MLNKLQSFSQHGNSIKFYPERGGIITSLKIKGKELLFQGMLEETLFNNNKSVRGGIPILFPQAGPLTESEQEKLGYKSPQHGIIRNLPFSYAVFNNKVELIYKNTTQEIPYSFELQVAYFLTENGLKIEYLVRNLGNKDLPISPGFHPYFNIKNKDTIKWQQDVSKKIIADKENWKNGGTFNFPAPENCFSFEVPEIGNISITYGNHINNFWIWSLPEKSFVCVEPVNGNEGNIIKNPIIVRAGKIFSSYIKISLD